MSTDEQKRNWLGQLFSTAVFMIITVAIAALALTGSSDVISDENWVRGSLIMTVLAVMALLTISNSLPTRCARHQSRQPSSRQA